MRRPGRFALAGALVLAIGACSDGSGTTSETGDPVDAGVADGTGGGGVTGGDDEPGDDMGVPGWLDDATGGGTDKSDATGGDEPGGDEPGGDEPGGDEPGGDEPGGDDTPLCGGFGEACAEDTECCSGWCVPSADGYVCTTTCDGTCEDGYECLLLSTDGADPSFLCLDVTASLCQPCDDDAACNTGNPAAPNLCVSYGAEGSFCGLNCGPDGHACPDGYVCATIDGATEGTQSQCVLADEAAVCTCNAWAIELGSSTTCSLENAYGVCPGTRSCGADGLTACDGVEAAEEVCDGADDDCDGLIDDDVPSVACPLGACEGATVCVDGEEVCEGVGESVESCDGLDNDCDGETDEDTDAECHPYVCGGDGCLESCDEHADCADDAFCDLSDVNGNGATDECLPKLGDGVDCSGGDQGDVECASGRCANGHCCSAPEGDCCGADGDCGHLDVAPVCDASEASGCGGHRVDGVCGDDFVCGTETVGDPSGCAGEVCEASACAAGAWTPARTCDGGGACSPAAASTTCDDANICTNDTCDDAAGCAYQPFTGPSETACYSFEPSWTEGIGVCKAGKVACQDGSATGCEDQVGPTSEACNGLDDNCDGGTDESVASQCSPYLCLGEDGCATSCVTDADCVSGWFCDVLDLDSDLNSKECLPLLEAGDPCTADDQCAPGYCNNGFCCGSATGECCGSSAHCSHLSSPPVCATVSSCTGTRVDGVCGGDHVCSAQTVSDPSPCAGQVCAQAYCLGSTLKGGAACNGVGQCSSYFPDTNCVGTNDLACTYGCSGGGCTATMTNDAVAVACYLFEVFGTPLPVGFICDC